MKKLYLIAMALTLALSAAAQEKRHIFGVRAGLNVADLTFKSDGLTVSLDSRTTFHVGASYQWGFGRKLPFYLETGLYLTGRGSKMSLYGESVKHNMLYLQIPVLVNYHFDIAGVVTLQPYAGLYYGLGVQGKEKISDEYEHFEHSLFKEETVDGDRVAQSYRRSDLGLRFGVGVGFLKNFYAGLGYDLGLMNILKDADIRKDIKVRNGCFYIQVGYNF